MFDSNQNKIFQKHKSRDKNIQKFSYGDLSLIYNRKSKIARCRGLNGDIKRKMNCDSVQDLEIAIEDLLIAISQKLDNELSAKKEDNGNELLLNAIDQYKKQSDWSFNTQKYYVSIFKNIVLHFSDLNYNETILQKDIVIRLNITQEKISCGMANRVKKTMKKFFDYMLQEQIIPNQINPLNNLSKQYISQPRDSMAKATLAITTNPELSPITRLLSVAKEPNHKVLILLLAITGGRISEIRNIKWTDLHIVKKQPYLKLLNVKPKGSSRTGDNIPTREIDITLENYYALLDQKCLIESKVRKQKKRYVESNKIIHKRVFESPEKYDVMPEDISCPDMRTQFKGQWMISNKFQDKPGYGCTMKWLDTMWLAAYEKYKNDPDPWTYGRQHTHCNFAFHSFRKHFVSNFRFGRGENYNKSIHEDLQRMIGHQVGSTITDKIYTDFTQSIAKDKRHSELTTKSFLFKGEVA